MSQPLSTDAILDRFAYHPATPETAVVHDLVRSVHTDLALFINNMLTPSRETSLALTAVQEAMMWCNASVAIHGAPAASEDQRATPQPTHGQGQPDGKAVRVMTCPNCLDTVPVNTVGHVNPHWSEQGYAPGRFLCDRKV